MSGFSEAGGTDLTGLGTDNRIARWNGTDTVQDSNWAIDDGATGTLYPTAAGTDLGKNAAANRISTLFMASTIDIAGGGNLIFNENGVGEWMRLLAGGRIVVGNTTGDSSAILDIVSTSRGILTPRMTTVQKNAITVSAAREALMVYDTDNTRYEFYNGTTWVGIGIDGNGIYSGSDSLSVATTVTMAVNNLQFNSTGLTGLLLIDAVNDKIDIGTTVRLEPSGNSYFNGGSVSIGQTTASARLHLKGSGSTAASSSFLVMDSGLTTIFQIRNDGVVSIGNPTIAAERLHVKGSATSGSIIRNYFEGVQGVVKTDVTDVLIDGGTGNGSSGHKHLHIKGSQGGGGTNNDMLFIELTNAGFIAGQNVIRAMAATSGVFYDGFTMNNAGGVVIGEAPNTTITVLSGTRTTKRFTVVHNDTNVSSLGNLSHHGGYIENSVTSTTLGNIAYIRYGAEILSTGTYVDAISIDTLSVGLKVTSSGADHNFALVTGGGNVGIGGQLQGAADVTANNVVYIFNGTAPSAITTPANAFKMYSADIIAGNAAPHFMTENADIIKLYKQVALTAEDSAVIDASYDAVEQGVLNNVRTRLGEIEIILQNLGLL